MLTWKVLRLSGTNMSWETVATSFRGPARIQNDRGQQRPKTANMILHLYGENVEPESMHSVTILTRLHSIKNNHPFLHNSLPRTPISRIKGRLVANNILDRLVRESEVFFQRYCIFDFQQHDWQCDEQTSRKENPARSKNIHVRDLVVIQPPDDCRAC